MEVLANDIFNGYREMYYEGGASSVYFWDLDDDAFAPPPLASPPLPSPPLASPRLPSPPRTPSPPLAVLPRGLCPTWPPAHAGGDATRRAHPAADVETRIKGLNAGNWDAIHVVEVKPGASGR